MLKNRDKKKIKGSKVFKQATSTVIETLEDRVMLYGDTTTVQALPFDLFFNGNNGGLADVNGVGTGFTFVQPNKNTTATSTPEYNPNLININTNTGVLNLTTTGNATNGGPWEGDNTLVNGLETTFDASTTTGAWAITTRLQGAPSLSYLSASSDQGGIMFGPDDDDYVKLVAAAQPSPNQQTIQFIDETKSGSTYVHSISTAASYTNISFTSTDTLDLKMSGDPTTGTIIGSYRINSGAWVPLSQQFTYSGATESMFFSHTARAGIIAMAKNNLAPITVGFDSFQIDPGTPASQRPSISGITLSRNPTDNSVYRDTSIILSVVLPTNGAGVDPATMNSTTVPLINQSTGAVVPATYTTDGAGGVINIHPTSALSANTVYQVSVNVGLRDTNGNSFLPWPSSGTQTFTTGATVQNPTPSTLAFQDVSLNAVNSTSTVPAHNYTCVAFGPDGMLYASTLEGLILRWTVDPNTGLLTGAPQIITTMQSHNGNVNREVTGFAFDPKSTATNLLMWVDSSAYGSYGAADFTGKITLLSGANLTTYQDYVVGIPRSIKDHQLEQPVFGPDGYLYACVASNSAMGAPDNAWGNRAEDYLSASIIRVDVDADANSIQSKADFPLDVKTAGQTGGYSVTAANAQLTLYATGVRNSYDLVWYNGSLYASTNGSAANGNVPSTPAGYFESVTGFTNPQTEPDMLYKIVQGGYYGHPDPARGQYILDGGNPTGTATYTLPNGNTAVAFSGYPVGTKADPNYQGAFDVEGLDNSADGMTIYSGNAFGGIINNSLIVSQYSAPQDLAILDLGASKVTQTYTGVSGLENLNSPLDVTEFQLAKGSTTTNPGAQGDLYVSEYDAETITLLQPVAPGAKISTSKTTLYYTEPNGSSSSIQALSTQTITITNTGTSLLTFGGGAQTIIGTYAGDFKITSTLPASLAVNASTNVTVEYVPGSGSAVASDGTQSATLTITSNDTTTPVLSIALRGLPTSGYGGNAEPSGQYIFNLYQIPVNTGTPNAASNYMPYNPAQLVGDQELQIKQFVKAGNGPVTLTPLAAFTVTQGARVGYYDSGDPTSKSQLLELVGNTNQATQTVNPVFNGSTSFDPGSAEFGMYAEFPSFQNADKATDRDSYQEDQLNTWDSTVADQQKMRIYPMKDSSGNVIPNSYIFIPEDYTTADDNDLVFEISNVKPGPASAASTTGGGPSFGFINNDEDVNSNVLTFALQGEEQLQTIIPPATGLKEKQTPHSSIPLEIFNSGSTPMIINSIVPNSPLVGPVVNGTRTQAYTISGLPTLPYSLPAGGTLPLTVNFVAQGYLSGGTTGSFTNTIRGEVDGTLLVTTNDTNHPSKTFNLKGFWQVAPETTESGQYDEFPISQTIAAMGYTTNIGTYAQLQNAGGANVKVGTDEVLSPFWNLADPSQVVTVHQLQSYHTAGNTATFAWYLQGSTSNHNIMTSIGSDAETVYPRDSASGNPAAYATILNTSLTSAFGFEVDGWYSDNSRNDTSLSMNQTAADVGHYVRFYTAVDENGQVIPNTYIMIMDYEGENLDYNDNAYLISNIRPSAGLASPTDVGGWGDTNVGNTLTWAAVANPQSLLTGYNVYRDTVPAASDKNWTLLTPSPITALSFIDSTAVAGTQYYYKVTAVGKGTPAETSSTEISLTRPTTVVIPTAPSVSASPTAADTIGISWSLSSGASGYTLLRSTTGLANSFSTYATLGGGVSSYADTNVTTDSTYYYEVIATSSAGNSQASAAASATAIVAPSTPTGLQLTVNSSTAITLNWTGVTDTDSYTIARSDGNDQNFLPVSNVSSPTTTYQDTNLTPGVTYYYEIIANNVVDNSAPSTEQSAATALAAPNAPIADSAVANGSSQITVSWESTVNATSYIVQRGSSNTGPWTTVTPAGGVSTLSFADTGLNASTPYYYQVFAANSIGTSATASNVVSTTTTIAAPAAPAKPTLTNVTSTSIQVNWSSVPTAATYTVYRSLDGSTNWTAVFTTLDNATFTYVDNGLTANTPYFYDIVATNVGGNSTPSASATATTPQVAAAAPGTLTVSAVAAAQSLSLSWGASANATGYDIQRSAPDTGSGYSWTTIGSTVGSASTTYTDNQVSFGTTYAYQIVAKNSVANSTGNVASGTVVPAAPATLSGSTASFVTINLNWSDVTGETGFSIERAPAGSTTFAVVGTVGQGVLTYVDSSLVPATSYIYRVRAQNAGGYSAYSQTFNATTKGTSILQDVGGTAFTDSQGNHWVADNPSLWSGGTISNGSVSIANTNDDYLYYTRRYGNMTYTLPADNGSYTLKLYFADPTMTGTGQRVFNVLAQGTTILSKFDIVKTAGVKTANIQTFNINITTGQLVVQFQNITDNAIISAIQLIPNQPNQPATPTNLTAAAVDSKTISLSWTNNATNDTFYEVDRSLDQTTWTLVSSSVPGSTIPGTTLNYTDAGLKANTHYFYRVRATNGIDSLNSNINSATTIVAAPVGLSALGTGPTSINVTWTAVAGAASYTVQRSSDGLTGWATVGSPTSNNFGDTGLTNGSTYYYRVSATVPAGTTSYSTVVSSPTGANVAAPSPVTNEQATANTATQITLSWSSASGATSYKIYRNTDDSSNWALESTVTDTGLASYSYLDNMLTPGQTYYYEVLATNAGGSAVAPSPDASATTMGLPASPTGLAVGNVTSSEIDLSWNAVAGAINYTLQRSPTGLAGSWTTLNTVNPSGNATETYADQGLNAGTKYYYQLSVTTSAGTSLYSTPVNATTTPNSPTGLNVTKTLFSEVDLSWNAVSGATSYTVQQSPTGLAGSWTTLNSVNPSGNSTESYADTTVSPSSTYYYQVITNVGTAASAPGASVNTTTPAQPVAPALAIWNTLYNEVDMSWNVVNGAISYTLQRSQTGLANSWTTIAQVPSTGITSQNYSDTTVSSSTPYYYQLLVTTSAGTSAPSAAVNTTTPASPLISPTQVAVSGIQSSQVTLSWNDSSPVITGFTIQTSTDGQNWGNPVTVGNVNSTIITGLLPSQTYYFEVCANNGNASSAYATTSAIQTLAPAVASTVIVDDTAATLVGAWTSGTSTSGFYGTDYLSDGNTGKGTKTATFTPNLTAAGSYEVFARWTAASSRATNVPYDITSASGTSTVTVNQQNNNGKWVSLGIFQFNAGTAGSVTIRTTGTNGYVIADAVEFVPTATAPVAPAQPTAFTVSSIQSTQATLTWSESSTAVTGFTIQESTNNTTWSAGTTVGNVNTANVTNLTPNQTYYFRISASNGSAVSAYTTTGPAVTPTGTVVASTVIVDNTTATTVGAWTAGTTTSGFYGSNYLSDGNTAKGTKSVTFTPSLAVGGTYQVYARWTAASSRASNVPIDISHQGTVDTVTVNQQTNGGKWVLLGTYTFNAGSTDSVTIRTTGTNGYVIADAVEFVPVTG